MEKDSFLFKLMLGLAIFDAGVLLVVFLLGLKGLNATPLSFRLTMSVVLASVLIGIAYMQRQYKTGLIIYTTAIGLTYLIATIAAINALPYLGSYFVFTFLILKLVINIPILVVFWKVKRAN